MNEDMTRGDLLRHLFESYSQNDDQAFRSVALQIIAEEQEKHNAALASDLTAILNEPARHKKGGEAGLSDLIPHDSERGALLVDVRRPTRALNQLVLNKAAQHQLDRVIRETRRSELLRVHSLRPKRKILFYGPPGCGKTATAEAIAHELDLPLLYTRFDAIVSSYLGETAANLRKVFDYASKGSWVVLFDEFDAIGKSRENESEHGEIRRVVNTFLQLLDYFPGESLIIAATNHEHLLDRALWRRFEEVVYFPRPDAKAISQIMRIKLANFPHVPLNYDAVASALKGFSGGDVEWVCLEAMKEAILSDKDAVSKVDINEAVARLRTRPKTSDPCVAAVGRRRSV